MKIIILLFILSASNLFAQQEVKDEYKVYKIETTEDGDYILFIKNEKDIGLVVMDNDSLNIDKSFKKIKLNKKYYFVLEKDDKVFRGEPAGGYMIISNSGNTKKIWDVQKDGEMPSIYTARNVKGIHIKE